MSATVAPVTWEAVSLPVRLLLLKDTAVDCDLNMKEPASVSTWIECSAEDMISLGLLD